MSSTIIRRSPVFTDSLLELGLSFFVGCGAAGYATYLFRQSIRSYTTDIVASIEPLRGQDKLSFEELYSPVPKARPNSFYAAFATSWNSALSSLRKSISDIFAP